MKLLITELHTLPVDVKERLENIGLTVDYTDGTTKVEPEIYDVVYGQLPFRRFPYEEFKALKFLQLSCAGTDHLPIHQWRKDGLLLSNAKGVYSAPIAEMIVMAILMSLKQAKTFMTQQDEHRWKKHDLKELGLMKVLFLGTGNIATETAARLVPFGAWLVGLNTDGRSVAPFASTGTVKDVKAFLPAADFVVNTLPYTPDTHHLMDDAFFAAMKPHSTFINIGRGKSVDEQALLKALNSDQLDFAYLDVFEEEPLSETSPLWAHPKVVLTPHNSGSSQLMPERNFALLINNLRHYLAQESLENQL